MSTKMQVSWSPMARWISAAVTVESTPPLSPQTTPAVPTRARMRSRLALDEVLHRPVGRGVADAEEEVLQQLAAARRVHHLGMELDAVALPRAVGAGGDRRVVAVRQHLSSRAGSARAGRRGSSTPASCWPRAKPAKRSASSSTISSAGPYSRASARAMRAAVLLRRARPCRSRCRAAARRARRCADRQRRVRLVDARRPAREDDALRLHGRECARAAG